MQDNTGSTPRCLWLNGAKLLGTHTPHTVGIVFLRPNHPRVTGHSSTEFEIFPNLLAHPHVSHIDTSVKSSLRRHLVPPLHGGDEKPKAQRGPGTWVRSHSKNWIKWEPEFRPCDAWTCLLPTRPAATSLIPWVTDHKARSALTFQCSHGLFRNDLLGLLLKAQERH